MKYRILALMVLVIGVNLSTKADEGMWLPSLVGKLNIQKMSTIGCKLTAEDIYSINHSSLKDAVVALDHGSCTAEVVSADGLLLTNHHCGFGEIQAHSSVEHDYLRDGFWAMKREEELPNPGKSVTFLVRVDDVTDQVLANVTDQMDESARQAKIREASAKIEKEARKGNEFETRVRSLFEANRYYLFVTQTFKDIRLVGTPPQSIGKFGGEADNWMWPRHTGDFSMFRIYCAPDGKPAEYSKDNVPYHPKKFFPVSIKGAAKNDFSMVMGYPGTTNRYKAAVEVQNTMDVVNEVRITAREAKLAIMRDYMATSDTARIKYASKFARSSNYYKYSIGQNHGLTNLDVINRKKAFEAEFQQWANGTPERKAKYGTVLDSIQGAYQNKDARIADEYMREGLLRGGEIFGLASWSSGLHGALKAGDKNNIKIEADAVNSNLNKFFKDYDAKTDEKIVGTLLKIYANKVNPQYFPTFFKEVQSKNKGDYMAFTKKMFAKTIFADSMRMKAFLKNPSLKKLDKDPAYQTMRSIGEMQTLLFRQLSKSRTTLEKAHRLFLAGIMEMNPYRSYYPDANSTMRLTYGVINGYEARDATYYNYFTTLKGYAEKGIKGDADFDFPDRLITLSKAKDFGPYADQDGTLHTCFTSNNDITGGNSGSPVVNGNGELIGIAFDGNWEAMSGDVAFEPDLQRCICVDIRFVLWTIDKYAGASHLVNEMKVIR